MKCSVKGVIQGFPLIIVAEKIENINSDFNSGKIYALWVSVIFILIIEVCRNLSNRINWNALRQACKNLNLTDLDEIGDFDSASADVSIDSLRVLHHVLFEIHIIEGELICPDSGRKFPIKEGIPNMLLHEDEL